MGGALAQQLELVADECRLESTLIEGYYEERLFGAYADSEKNDSLVIRRR